MGRGLGSRGSRGASAHRRVRVAAVGGIAALLLAPLIAIPTPASAATKSSTPILVGGDSSNAENPGLAAGFEAGIYRFNKAGGLDGRKLKFVGSLDDQFSTATSLTNAQQLVERDHVMVVAPVDTAVPSGGTGTFLAEQKVPFIGFAASAPFGSAPKWG